MLVRILMLALTLELLGSARPLLAQINLPYMNAQSPQLTVATTVTFTLPLKLTQLSPDLEKVRVVCLLGSEGLAMPAGFTGSMEALPKAEMSVVAGQVEATMSVVVPIYAELLRDPIGKTAEYQCGIQGFSKSIQNWGEFSEGSTTPAFMLKPTPPLIKGTFVWVQR